MDLNALRLDQNFDAAVGVKKLLTTVPVRKPNRSEFVRVRSGGDFQMRTCIIELKEDREVYLVARGLWDDLVAELQPVLLRLTINRQGVATLWMLKLPRGEGRTNPWSESAMEAATRAETTWISLRANMALGAYEIYAAAGDLPEPTWPTESFDELVKIAFRGKFIADRDHAVLRRLRGEV
jgi:hypothetical protein